MQKHYESLGKNTANYTPLTPISFLVRTAKLFGDRLAVVYQNRQYTWQDVYNRSVQLASALNKNGIQKGDTVSVLLPNVPEMVEAHFGIPMSGAVINTINFRLDDHTIAYILEHSDCRALLIDSQFIDYIEKIIKQNNLDIFVIRVDDNEMDFQNDKGNIDYNTFLAGGDVDFAWQLPEDEWQALALNYTSGTSGKPKGVVYHHRGSYLMSMGTVGAWQLPMHPRYLYTVPLFHCNGWSHAWAMAIMAGTIFCVRQISAKLVFDLLSQHKITHFGAAPVVLGMLINAEESEKFYSPTTISVITAGSPPPPTVLKESKRLGFEITQCYGLTETYGHIAYCLWKEKWNELGEDEQASIKSWQGISFPMVDDIALANAQTGDLIPLEQMDQGEILIRGNTVMKGYYKDIDATEKAFENGWFHSGDVAIWQDTGYLQIRDRIKDVIISGGENISSVEVEGILYKHPAIANAAVVAKPDEKWGEVPCSFVEIKPNQTVTKEELTDFCRQHLAGFKVPKSIVFCELPKTATGKIQKFVLRNQIKNGLK